LRKRGRRVKITQSRKVLKSKEPTRMRIASSERGQNSYHSLKQNLKKFEDRQEKLKERKLNQI